MISNNITEKHMISRITLMVCTSATGMKAPLAVVGEPVRPTCFTLCQNKPPIKYCNQQNAWFDKQVTSWWIKEVFGKFCR
jgi:hypothetical protein